MATAVKASPTSGSHQISVMNRMSVAFVPMAATNGQYDEFFDHQAAQFNLVYDADNWSAYWYERGTPSGLSAAR